MAKQRQPIALIQSNGKKHLTKGEIEDRTASEVTVPIGDVRPPKYLNAAQKKKFKRIAKILVAAGIFTELDVDTLARYLIAETLYLNATKSLNNFVAGIEENELDLTLAQKEKLVNVQDKYAKQCRNFAADLGLTVSSRCRLIVPKGKPEKPQNKFSKLSAV